MFSSTPLIQNGRKSIEINMFTSRAQKLSKHVVAHKAQVLLTVFTKARFLKGTHIVYLNIIYNPMKSLFVQELISIVNHEAYMFFWL